MMLVKSFASFSIGLLLLCKNYIHALEIKKIFIYDSGNYGVYMKFIFSFIFLLSFSAQAKTFDIRCSSKNFDRAVYKGFIYDRAYFTTAGCYELSATFGAEEKAIDQCRQWADFYGIKNYDAKIYPRSSDQFTQCHPDSKKITDFMIQKKYNKVPEIEVAYKESGTIIYYTHLYIDNHADPPHLLTIKQPVEN